MTKVQVDQAFEAGKILVKGTFWSGRVETRSVRDKERGGGARREAHVVHQTVMTASDPMVISRWMNDGEKPESYVAPCKQGDKCIVVIAGLEMNNGVAMIRGTIEPLT